MVGFSTQMRTFITYRGPCQHLILLGVPLLSLRETSSSLCNQSFLALGKGTAIVLKSGQWSDILKKKNFTSILIVNRRI